MAKQIVFLIVLLITLGIFAWTMNRIAGFFRITRPAFPVRETGKRIALTLKGYRAKQNISLAIYRPASCFGFLGFYGDNFWQYRDGN